MTTVYSPANGMDVASSLTDPILEAELQALGEVPIWRGSGKPSWKQAATPIIFVTITLCIMGAVIGGIASMASSHGDGGFPAAALAAPLSVVGLIILLMVLWAVSITRQVYYVAVTPRRVIAIRRGGCCSGYLTSVALNEIIQLQSNVSPPGLCCAPGPFLSVHTMGSLSAGYYRRRGRGPPPALAVAMTDGNTINGLRHAIESTRASIPGMPPLSTTTYGISGISYGSSTYGVPAGGNGFNGMGETYYTPQVPAVAVTVAPVSAVVPSYTAATSGYQQM